MPPVGFEPTVPASHRPQNSYQIYIILLLTITEERVDLQNQWAAKLFWSCLVFTAVVSHIMRFRMLASCKRKVKNSIQ